MKSLVPVMCLSAMLVLRSVKADQSASSGDEAVHKGGSSELGDSTYFVHLKVDQSNRCNPNPCKHDGVCTVNHDFIDGYRCACKGDFGGINCQTLECRTSLPQYTSTVCSKKRAIGRKIRKRAFSLRRLSESTKESTAPMVPVLQRKSVADFIQSASSDPFTIEWYMKMVDNADMNKDLESRFTLKDPHFHDTPTLIDFAIVYRTFYRHHQKHSAMSALRRVPSIEENFYKDRCFADQRLAGANPFQLWRVTKEKEDVGVDWNTLETKMNKEFDWKKAFLQAMNSKVEEDVEKALEEGQIYIAHYPELDGIKVPDRFLKKDAKFNNTVLQLTAPLAFFVVMETEKGVSRLIPVAIQSDSNPKAKVYSPNDGKDWFYAKSLVQRADINVLHLVQKRLKNHLYIDAFCTLMEKHFSDYHPLYQMFRHHTRATLETNKLFELKLYGFNGPIFKVLNIDPPNGIKMLNKEYRKMKFQDLDFLSDLQKRGVSDKEKLPFYPYRDDGLLLYQTLKNFTRDYVNLYYEDDKDVINDEELRDFTVDVASNGNGSAQVTGFPEKITSKAQLSNILTTLLWTFTGRHAAVTYPIVEYAGFIPNAPHRIYRDRKGLPQFSNEMFGNKAVALEIAELSSNLGGIHLDQLFDYYSKLKDDKGQQLVHRYYENMDQLSKLMLENNEQHVKNGFLPYPYFLPEFVSNSIST